jgi:hypothetical protein
MDWFPDYWALIGIVIAGATGIVGILWEVRDKKTHKITISGRTLLCITILSTAGAFVAQVLAIARNKKAQEETTALAREAAQLRQALTWPTISSELGQNLIARLAAVPTSVPRNVMLAWLANDPQTQLLAAQFGIILSRAGWRVVATQARTYMSPAPLFGIFLEGPQSEAVQALTDAFSAVGISFRTDAVGGSFTATGSGSMFLNPPPPTLLVGSKGPPF